MFPHLPQATISWVKKQHPAWAPDSQWPDLPGLKGLKFNPATGLGGLGTPGANSPFAPHTWEVIKQANTPSAPFSDFGLHTVRPTPPRSIFGNALLMGSPTPSASPSPAPHQLPTRLTVPDGNFPRN